MNTKYIQISAGKGPAECCWVVSQVLKTFLNEGQAKGLEINVIEREKGPENGTLLSATVEINGKNLESFLSGWVGTIQWVGQSQYRKFHKRKNWFVGITLLDTGESTEFRDSEVKFQAIRSGGPGGQHVNKVSTAIRATHIPTGISVLASDSRSQYQNKKNAIERLKLAIHQLNTQKVEQKAKSKWQQHQELERGNPVRVFQGTDFKKQRREKKNKRDKGRLNRQLKSNFENDLE